MFFSDIRPGMINLKEGRLVFIDSSQAVILSWQGGRTEHFIA